RLRLVLRQIFYLVRSERMLIEQLQYNLLFRWFVVMEMDEGVWNHAVCSKNRERSSRSLVDYASRALESAGSKVVLSRANHEHNTLVFAVRHAVCGLHRALWQARSKSTAKCSP